MLSFAGCGSGSSNEVDAGIGDTSAGDGGNPALSLSVAGTNLVDGNGHVIHLRGVNYSGTEYSCVQGNGIFDGPNDEASVQAIASWHIRSVRLPLNEDCWLGINGVAAAYSGATYRAAIVEYVKLLHKYGLYVELELHWSAAGTQLATAQDNMPNVDHSVPFWTSVATTFKDDPAVLFGTFNEPFGVTWPCWLSGGSSCSLGYTAAGQQQLVDAIRATGATNVIAISAMDYANNLTSFLQYKPIDPLHQLLAEAHIYGGNACATTACLDQDVVPVAQTMPVIFGEVGEHFSGNQCGATNMMLFLPWADAHGVSYQAWTWDTWGDCLSLISNFDGTVNASAAQAGTFKSHLASLVNTP